MRRLPSARSSFRLPRHRKGSRADAESCCRSASKTLIRLMQCNALHSEVEPSEDLTSQFGHVRMPRQRVCLSIARSGPNVDEGTGISVKPFLKVFENTWCSKTASMNSSVLMALVQLAASRATRHARAVEVFIADLELCLCVCGNNMRKLYARPETTSSCFFDVATWLATTSGRAPLIPHVNGNG